MSAILYWLAIRAYAIALRIASLFHPKAKQFFAGRKGLLAAIRYALINEKRQRIWMHCASLGEFEQGRPVLEQLRKDHPEYAIVLSFFSPSGYEVRKDYAGADYVFYLPLDSVLNAKRFLNIVQPRLCVFVKYELWYFFLAEMARRNIPLILVSAIFRKDQPFFKWYGRLHRRMLHCFTHIFVQDRASMELLGRIDVTDVSVSGDTRFDRVIEAVQHKAELPIADDFCAGHKIIVAGSTWKEDEVFLKHVIDALPATWKMILVPHEVHEAHIDDIMSLYGKGIVRWSDEQGDSSKRVLLVDKVGLLLQLYRYADVAWVGGGFDKEGVHNVLEAAVYHIPVGHGPVYQQFLEAKELLAEGGSTVTDEPAVFIQAIAKWEQDVTSYEQCGEAAGHYVLSRSGATHKIITYIEEKNWLKSL